MTGLDMPVIQTSTYSERIREQKEHFAQAITKAAIENLKAKRRQQHVIRKSYYQSLSENRYNILADQSSKGGYFGISRMDKKGMEI
jgi:CHAD domain-containing protein